MSKPTIKICNDGAKEYYLDGFLHRDDGPAIDWEGYKAWYRHGRF